MENEKRDSNGVGTFLVILGYSIIGLGVLAAMGLSFRDFDFDGLIFFSVLLSTCSGGGIIIGLGELVNSLHKIHKDTQEINSMNTKMSYLVEYQQGIIDALLEKEK